MTEKIHIGIENAKKMFGWITECGGIAVWRSISLSDPGASCFTPAMTADTSLVPMSKPHWKYANAPEYIIYDSKDVIVHTYKEVKRFHVAVRVGSQGLMVKCTDASTRRIWREVEKAGEDATYEFDHGTQEAVILKRDGGMTLAEWHDKKSQMSHVSAGNEFLHGWARPSS